MMFGSTQKNFLFKVVKKREGVVTSISTNYQAMLLRPLDSPPRYLS